MRSMMVTGTERDITDIETPLRTDLNPTLPESEQMLGPASRRPPVRHHRHPPCRSASHRPRADGGAREDPRRRRRRGAARAYRRHHHDRRRMPAAHPRRGARSRAVPPRGGADKPVPQRAVCQPETARPAAGGPAGVLSPRLSPRCRPLRVPPHRALGARRPHQPGQTLRRCAATTTGSTTTYPDDPDAAASCGGRAGSTGAPRAGIRCPTRAATAARWTCCSAGGGPSPASARGRPLRRCRSRTRR